MKVINLKVIMFQIFNQSGKVVAFGGRTLDKEEPAKYINSPDTPLYHKSDVLYGLHLSAQTNRQKKSVVLVEGYMDLKQLYQAGITNVVAASGTALTERHVQQIKKFGAENGTHGAKGMAHGVQYLKNSRVGLCAGHGRRCIMIRTGGH